MFNSRYYLLVSFLWLKETYLGLDLAMQIMFPIDAVLICLIIYFIRKKGLEPPQLNAVNLDNWEVY